MSKEDFINFYRKTLNFTDSEFELFLSSINSPLPSALRIINSNFKTRIEQKLTDLQKNKFFKDVYETEHKGSLHKEFIINQTTVGNIQRQEIVSMLPVLLMDLKPHHTVLDMCAAPGSKTKQILEIAGNTGLVVANDCSGKRLNVLVTEATKIPHKSFLVIQHDASHLPLFKNDFDRVLCDVPCSGDGTIRKNPVMMENWKLSNAIGLSSVQYRILKNAVRFVRMEGLIIYSTCSLNPIENEVIVQKAVIEDDLEIVDLREFINEEKMSKEFKLSDGLTNWDVGVKECKNISFVPTEKDIGLSKCIRVYPHANNTGGFFIVGLRKRSKKVSEIRNKKPNKHVSRISEEMREMLSTEYDIKDKILVQYEKGKKMIYEVSVEVNKIIENNKLIVIYSGYKLFEKCNLSISGFRMKNVLDEYGKITYHIEIKSKDTEMAIRNKEYICEFRRGSVIVFLFEFKILIVGYSLGSKVMLYISNNLQKALLDYFPN